MRESKEMEEVTWELEKCSMKVVSGGMTELHFQQALSPKRGVVRSLKKPWTIPVQKPPPQSLACVHVGNLGLGILFLCHNQQFHPMAWH